MIFLFYITPFLKSILLLDVIELVLQFSWLFLPFISSLYALRMTTGKFFKSENLFVSSVLSSQGIQLSFLTGKEKEILVPVAEFHKRQNIAKLPGQPLLGGTSPPLIPLFILFLLEIKKRNFLQSGMIQQSNGLLCYAVRQK